MSKSTPVIVVTRKLPDKVESRLNNLFDARLNRDDNLPGADELIAAAQGADALLVCPTDKIDADLVQRLPDSIRMIATFSVGCDHIDVAAAGERGIMVTNTPDVLTDATADIAMLLMLGAARGAVWGDAMVRDATWAAWCPTKPLGIQVTGKPLGILGMGRIGRAMAKRARGFDMEIHYHGRRKLDPDLEQGAIFHDNLDDFLTNCAFLSIHCASTPQTRGLINAETIAKLPDHAVIVNSARGDIIVDDALIAALKSGKVAAAGLDVFANE
ncbi:MAG: D-glycerate dehydrogenase, partial [Fimbriimonadaceae bacterium]|nr:D-glycerate dehydrogenase [Alphaproteobacteria bacterium]